MMVAVALALPSSATACAHRPTLSPPQAQNTCPSEFTTEILHDAAFHLDRGDDDARVEQDLVDARARVAADGAGAAWALGFIQRMEATLRRDSGSRQFGAEVVRADLHESPCLTPEMHARFHRRLPAVGVPETGPSPEGP